MNVKKLQFESLYEWLVSALFFWVFLACVEVSRTVIVNGFPPPLGKGSLPSAIDARYLVTALSIYALLSVPTALILLATEKICSWLKEKTWPPFLDLNRMDIYLLLGFGLLYFRWISNLMPFLLDGEHLPNIPYLLIVPLLGIHLWVDSFSKKTISYYRMNWMMIFLGTVFLSKTAYDIFISSSLSMVVRGCLFVLFALGALLLARVVCSLLNRMLLNRVKPRLAYAVFFILLLTGGVIYTHHAWQTKNNVVSSLPRTAHSQGERGAITKNVIVVLVDCLRADHLGCYGYTRKTSPFLDHIARSGITFENCIAPSSWTIPSVVSLFTGVYPQQHGMSSLGTVIPEDLSMLQEIMEKNGVETAAFTTNDFLKPQFGYAKGFVHYFDHYLEPEFKEYLASRLFFLNALLYFKNNFFYPYSVDPGGERWWSIGFPPFNHEKRSAARVTEDVLQWIETHRDKPFYVYLHYMDVHSPYDATWYSPFDRETYASQDERGKLINTYDGRIAYVDRQIKRIWEELVKLNVSENTLLIVTADHGEEFYDHEGTGHCTTLYDELIRVPLIMIAPSLPPSPPGMVQRVKNQVQLIDLPATVLDFLDLQIPKEMMGQSLLP
ncbi:MAG: sulfatase, partial [Deltaproteobacteria bacterium]|nr:sulfatase [Deltaproteobacteria bacterium]